MEILALSAGKDVDNGRELMRIVRQVAIVCEDPKTGRRTERAKRGLIRHQTVLHPPTFCLASRNGLLIG